VLVALSDWYTLFVPALLAALGFAGKQVWDAIVDWRSRAKARRVRLHQLQSLLSASLIAFQVQRAQAGRLAQSLAPGGAERGLEDLFARLYENFTPEQSDLHTIIRAYSEFALHPLNEALQKWLADDTDHRVAHRKHGLRAKLAQQLNHLDAHVWLWLAKYEAWIPNEPRHALVYLEDEQEHGLGFPVGIDDTLQRVLAETLWTRHFRLNRAA
jgi:hypothetical protein